MILMGDKLGSEGVRVLEGGYFEFRMFGILFGF